MCITLSTGLYWIHPHFYPQGVLVPRNPQITPIHFWDKDVDNFCIGNETVYLNVSIT